MAPPAAFPHWYSYSPTPPETTRLISPFIESQSGRTNSGGVGEYEYQWGNAAGGATDSVVQNLSAGIYTVTVTDSAGCAMSLTILLNDLNSPELQLDSLADMVTSGIIPGIFMYQLFNRSLGIHEKVNEGHSWSDALHWFQTEVHILPLFGLIVTLASAYRLAKFNIDDNQTSSFIGLPTPANTLLIISLPLILMYQGSETIDAIILNKWFLIGFTLLCSYLLNANIPLFALKFKDWSFKNNTTKYIFIIVCILLLVFLHFLAIPIIILLYVLISLFKK